MSTEHKCKECKHFNKIPPFPGEDDFCWCWMFDVNGNDNACDRFEDEKEEAILVVVLVLFFLFFFILAGTSGN